METAVSSDLWFPAKKANCPILKTCPFAQNELLPLDAVLIRAVTRPYRIFAPDCRNQCAEPLQSLLRFGQAESHFTANLSGNRNKRP